jgi:hypothetical protein
MSFQGFDQQVAGYMAEMQAVMVEVQQVQAGLMQHAQVAQKRVHQVCRRTSTVCSEVAATTTGRGGEGRRIRSRFRGVQFNYKFLGGVLWLSFCEIPKRCLFFLQVLPVLFPFVPRSCTDRF